MSWRGNGKSGEVSSPSVARRSLVHGGVTATTVIFCFPSSENPCPSSKRMCPALFPFGAFSTGFMKRPDVCFSSSPKSPERGKDSAFLRHRHPGPGRSRRSGAAPRPCPGMLAPGGNRPPPQSSRSTAPAAASPKNTGRPRRRPGRASQAGRAEGAAGRTSAGRAVRRQPPPAAREKRLAWSLFFPLTPQPGPAAAADLWQDFCSGRERGEKSYRL